MLALACWTRWTASASSDDSLRDPEWVAGAWLATAARRGFSVRGSCALGSEPSLRT